MHMFYHGCHRLLIYRGSCMSSVYTRLTPHDIVSILENQASNPENLLMAVIRKTQQ
jgi:hypothetical protein